MKYLPSELVVVPKDWLEQVVPLVEGFNTTSPDPNEKISENPAVPLEPLLNDAHRQGWDDYYDGEHRDRYKRDLLATPIEFKP